MTHCNFLIQCYVLNFARCRSGKPCRFSVIFKTHLLRYETLFTVTFKCASFGHKNAESIGDLSLTYSSHIQLSNFARKALMRQRRRDVDKKSSHLKEIDGCSTKSTKCRAALFLFTCLCESPKQTFPSKKKMFSTSAACICQI